MIKTIIICGLASIYHPGDGYTPGKVMANGKEYNTENNGFANRTIKIHRRGIMCNVIRGRCSHAIVTDRGPYGAIREIKVSVKHDCKTNCKKEECGKVRKIIWKGKDYCWQRQNKLIPGWVYRGEFDLSVKLAKRLRVKSMVDSVCFAYKVETNEEVH